VAAQKKSKKKASNRSPTKKYSETKSGAVSKTKKLIGSAEGKKAKVSVSGSTPTNSASSDQFEYAGSAQSALQRSAIGDRRSEGGLEIGKKRAPPDCRLDRKGKLLAGGAGPAGCDLKKIAELNICGNEVMESVSHRYSGKLLSALASTGDPVSSEHSVANETSLSVPVLSPTTTNPLTSGQIVDGEDMTTAKVAKSGGNKHGFKTGEFVVYPSHGVGQIVSIEEKEVAGFRLELFVISFAKDKMTLRVPIPKVSTVGMRKLSDDDTVRRALDTLLGRARVKRTMWSRRAQEYEAKINSGDLVAIAEVVRDLYRSEAQPEQSYSERQLYEAALDRIAREISVVRKFVEAEALKIIESQLQKGQRRTGRSEANGEAVGPSGADVEEAA